MIKLINIMNLTINQLVNKLLETLNPRQKDILEKRYGLKDNKMMTLEGLGKSYGVTRERIRQIEDTAFKELESGIKSGLLNQFFAKVEKHLKNLGGLRRETLLLADLQLLLAEDSSPTFDNKISFLLGLSKSFKYSPKESNFYSYWYLEPADKKKAAGFINKLEKYMKNKKEEIVSHRNIDKVFKANIRPSELKELVALNYLSVSKKFHINQYGDFGLSSWPEINPRTVRDWTYLILGKESKPVHFTDIAKMIDGVRGNRKTTNAQTVHNELIRDNRFVLVGRGIYGLRDFGFTPGTTREVMKRLLKSHGPLDSKDLLDLVLKERMLKKNTILVNLQNRKYFKRLNDGRYTINQV